MGNGWVSVHRQLQDHWLWQDKPFSKGQAWIDLIMLANHKPGTLPFKGDMIQTERGSVFRSISWLADRWGWSRDKTRTFFKQLQADGMVTIKSTTHQTTINIVNYSFFQDSHPTDTATDQSTNRQQTSQPADTYNNVNNVNNVNKNNRRKFIFAPPTVEEVRNYCLEHGYTVDPDGFVDFYESKGWMVGKNKMKNWKAAVRTWARNSHTDGREKNDAEKRQKSVYGEL